MNNECDGMWKEAFMTYFELFPPNLPGGPEEIHEYSKSGLTVSRSEI
jgi:hypothetical protein